jgi:hypothetical protein
MASLLTSPGPDRDECPGAHRSNPVPCPSVPTARKDGSTKELRRALEKEAAARSVRSSPFLPSGSPCPRQVSSDPLPNTSPRTFTGFSSGRNRRVPVSGSTAGVVLKKRSIKPTLILDSRALQTFDRITLIRRRGAQSFKNFCISLACSAISGRGEASVSAMVGRKLNFVERSSRFPTY